METHNLIWTPAVRKKIIGFRSSRFIPEETFDFISQIVLEPEELLKNPFVGKVYTEEYRR